MPVVRKISAKLQGFLKDTSAAATVEFIILFPMLIWIVFSTFEIGWLTTRQMMLNRGLNLTIRDLRLGRIDQPTHEKLKLTVCDRASILKDCTSSIHLELVPMTLAGGIPKTSATCVDRTGEIDPVENFSAGIEEDIMFVRACVIVDPMLPGMGIGAQLHKDPTGGFSMVAYSAFKREP